MKFFAAVPILVKLQTAAAGNADLLARRLGMIHHQHAPAARSGVDRAHQCPPRPAPRMTVLKVSSCMDSQRSQSSDCCATANVTPVFLFLPEAGLWPKGAAMQGCPWNSISAQVPTQPAVASQTPISRAHVLASTLNVAHSYMRRRGQIKLSGMPMPTFSEETVALRLAAIRHFTCSRGQPRAFEAASGTKPSTAGSGARVAPRRQRQDVGRDVLFGQFDECELAGLGLGLRVDARHEAYGRGAQDHRLHYRDGVRGDRRRTAVAHACQNPRTIALSASVSSGKTTS